jgi:hypothetical protein
MFVGSIGNAVVIASSAMCLAKLFGKEMGLEMLRTGRRRARLGPPIRFGFPTLLNLFSHPFLGRFISGNVQSVGKFSKYLSRFNS